MKSCAVKNYAIETKPTHSARSEFQSEIIILLLLNETTGNSYLFATDTKYN